MTPASGYLTNTQAMAFLGLPSLNAFYTLRSRLKAEGRPMKTYWLRGQMRFKESDLSRLVASVRRVAA